MIRFHLLEASDQLTNTTVLFSKPAVPGRVKTRLTTRLSPEEAAQCHSAFLGDLVEEVLRGPLNLRIAWALEAEEPIPEGLFSGKVPGFRQVGEGLGERLYEGLRRVASDSKSMAAIGSDHPTLEAGRIAEAFRRVDSREADVVIGPATDGGYYLFATHPEALDPGLFSAIDWSTDRVLAQSIARAESRGLVVSLLPPLSDVDTPEDLDRLAETLLEGSGLACPRTTALFKEWGLI